MLTIIDTTKTRIKACVNGETLEFTILEEDYEKISEIVSKYALFYNGVKKIKD